jgi:serine/threonine-protein kinase
MGDFEFVVSEGPEKGRTFPFPGPHFYVGSGDECHVRLSGPEVQPKHAEIRFDPSGTPWIKDLTGKRLMAVNGELTEKSALHAGSFLRLGHLELAVRTPNTSRSGTLATPTPFRQQAPVSGTRNPAATSSARNAPASSARNAPVSSARNTAQSSPRIAALDSGGIDATARRPTPFQKPGAAPNVTNLTPLDDGAEYPQEATAISSILTPGTVIDGRYEVVGKLAAGGMGEVYKVQHVELGKPMAVKVMLPELSNDQEFVGRFKREAIAASRIGQQNIVDISDFGRTANGRFYFVMEFLDGMTLASLLHRQGAQAPERVLNISAQAARALAAAHAQSIVHRDLKPENIMLLQRPGQPDFVKVLDFGVAKVSTGHGQGGHTAVGMVVGTPQYMSPEQAKAIPVDTRSDIYSLGLIIYELVAGKPTFSAETPSMLMVKHVTEQPTPFDRAALGHVPEELEQLIFKMLQKEPDQRPQTMEEVLGVLETLWARVKSNDPSLKKVSGSFAPAGPQSGISRVRTSGQVQGITTSSTTGLQEEQLAQPPRSKLVPALVGLVVVLAIAVGVVVFKGDPETVTPPKQPEQPIAEQPKPPPDVKPVPEPPKPVAEKVKLTFTSTPEKVDVTEGDVLLGVTPLSLARMPSEIAELTFSAKGYKPVTRKVRFDAESTIPIELEKEKKAAPGGGKKPKGGGLADDPYSTQEELKDLPE